MTGRGWKAAVLAVLAGSLMCGSAFGDEKALITIDGDVVLSEEVPSQETNDPCLMSVVDRAVSFAVDVANDDANHGYNIDHGWGPGEYHCIGLVMTAYTMAGYDMGKAWTGHMPERLAKYGFYDVTGSVDLRTGAGLQKGDILWMMHPGGKHGHTELYAGDGLLVGARGLGVNDQIPGDQDGTEVSVIPYTNLSWQRAFRPPAWLCRPPISIETIYVPPVVVSEESSDSSAGCEVEDGIVIYDENEDSTDSVIPKESAKKIGEGIAKVFSNPLLMRGIAYNGFAMAVM